MEERESWTCRIRRSRKRPLGEAASPPSSMLDREKRSRGCGGAGAATHIFSSVGGQKIRAQQHRPLGGSPKCRERLEHRRAPVLLVSVLQAPPLSDRFFQPRPPRGDVSPTRRRSRRTRVEVLRKKSRRAGRRAGSSSLQSEHLIGNGNRWRRARPWPSLAAHDARRLPGASPNLPTHSPNRARTGVCWRLRGAAPQLAQNEQSVGGVEIVEDFQMWFRSETREF